MVIPNVKRKPGGFVLGSGFGSANLAAGGNNNNNNNTTTTNNTSKQRNRFYSRHRNMGCTLLAGWLCIVFIVVFFLYRLMIGGEYYPQNFDLANVVPPSTDSLHHHNNNNNNEKQQPLKTSDGTSTTSKAASSSSSFSSKRNNLDPSLWDGIDLQGDTTTATVMGMASGYGLDVYERFVGTLRKSGFQGHIILGVAPNVGDHIKRYFQYRNVTMKILQWTNCTYRTDDSDAGDIFKHTTCAHPYPDIKIRWSRFPLARDWLLECPTCTGPVLITDVRDAFFQLNPFGTGSPTVKGLQVFEEHKNQTTAHWLTDHPFQKCKGITNLQDKTMLCSGTTVGTRKAMLQYLQDMYDEMKLWINDPKCRFNFNGDDQSIHNYLYYSGNLPYATAIPNRHGGIVHTVGVEGAKLFHANTKRIMAEHPGLPEDQAKGQPYPGASGTRWIGKEYNLIDDEGYFIEFDGSRSRFIHQFDRLGTAYFRGWMKQPPQVHFFQDPMPPEAAAAEIVI